MMSSSISAVRSTARCSKSVLASARTFPRRQFTSVQWGGFCTTLENGHSKKQIAICDFNGQRAQAAFLSATAEKAPDIPADILPQMDFFAEPVTFLGLNSDNDATAVDTAITAMDEFLVAVVTKGKASTGGGDEEGIATKAAHSSAIVWADVLRHAAIWNKQGASATAPMLVVVAMGPLLAQTGVDYIRQLDKLLSQSDPSMVQMLPMAELAASMKDNPHLSPRERWHLQTLDCMLRHEHRKALTIMLILLQHCPGDALALSLALDIACTLGDRRAALRASGSVASYWHERAGRGLRPAIPGYAIASSWIALGFAAGGRFSEAERLAVRAMQQDVGGAGGVATWALAHAYDAEGRTAEGISMLAGDGVAHFEDCGLAFFDSRLAGYGARFSLDREGTRGGKVALRIYDESFEHILKYRGSTAGLGSQRPLRLAPKRRVDRIAESTQKRAKSIFHSLFGGREPSRDSESNTEPIVSRQATPDSGSFDTNSLAITMEDVLTWIPPTPQLLTDATLLLLRLTMNGTVSEKDLRWSSLRNAWRALDDLDKEVEEEGNHSPLDFYPLAKAASSLLSDESSRTDSKHMNGIGSLSSGLQLMGKLMGLGDPDGGRKDIGSEVDGETKDQWTRVVKLLSTPKYHAEDFIAWEMDIRPMVEHAICYAACLSEDYDSLCVARSICSTGVCLRPNSPEEWWRYSLVLDKLGDQVAAEDARAASVSMGSGEGVA